MRLREQICAEALSLVGTPWHHRAMLPGPQGGIDCVRTLEYAAKQCGLLALGWLPPVYSPDWMLHNNAEALLSVLTDLGCVAMPLEAREPGTILLFQYGRTSSHAAILVSYQPEYIVHAARDYGKVVHQRLAGPLLARLRQVYAFPGVTA